MRVPFVAACVTVATVLSSSCFAQEAPKIAKPELPALTAPAINPSKADVPEAVQTQPLTTPKATATELPKVAPAAPGSQQAPPPQPQASAPAPKPAAPKKAVLPVNVVPDELKSKASIAIQHVRANQPVEALAMLTQLLTAKPDLFTLAVERGKLYQAANDHEKAVADFTAALTAEPNHFEAYFRRCVSRYETGAHAQAVADCSKAIELNPEPFEYHYYRGLAHSTAKAWDKAVADLAAATERNNGRAEAHLQLARAYAEMEQLIPALREYTIAIQQKPGYPEAYKGRAAVRLTLGDSVGSNDDLNKAAR